MSTRIDQQLRDYFRYVDGEQRPIDITALKQHTSATSVVTQPRTPPPMAPRRRWLTPTVATAVAAGLLIASLLIVSPGSNDQTAPVATVPPIESLGTLEWSRVPHDDAVFGGEGAQAMRDVAAGGPGLVAVGSDGSNAAVWTSLYGISWARVPHDEAVLGGEGTQEMTGVAVAGPGLVAVGSDESEAAVWTSADGLTWRRVPHDEVVFGGVGHQEMTTVTAAGPGLVAAGWDRKEDADAAVWTSVDGLTWSRVSHDETIFGGADDQEIWDITAGGPGLVAVGSDGQAPWDYTTEMDAAVWTSVDGITWTRVPHDEAIFGGAGDPERISAMLSVTAGGPGLVAVGSDHVDFLETAPAWTSVDGITWSRVSAGDDDFRGAMLSVTSGGAGLVAVGFDAMVWASPNGFTWTHVAGTGGHTINSFDPACFATNCPPWPDEAEVGHTMLSVAEGGPGLVAVGWIEMGSGDMDAAVWTATTD